MFLFPFKDNHPPSAPTARAERRFRVLAELTDLGIALARAATRALREAEADPAELPTTDTDLYLTFTRLSRAVRQTLAL